MRPGGHHMAETIKFEPDPEGMERLKAEGFDIKPLPGANGDIKQGLKNLCDSIPKDTVIMCPYVFKIIPHPCKEASNV